MKLVCRPMAVDSTLKDEENYSVMCQALIHVLQYKPQCTS